MRRTSQQSVELKVTPSFQRFQRLLEELFQLDQADLDFGIYRIMNRKRDDIVRFLSKDLMPQVKTAFGQYRSADNARIQEELDKVISQITGAGMNPDDSPKVKDLRQQIATSSVDITALENEVFSHLFNFFRRYYHEGDFISQRRYKDGVYAVPYEGEEVKLYWANHDQYYVKSSEYFRDYTFAIASGRSVRVHLISASSEQENKKEQGGRERRFFILSEDPLDEVRGELFIRFEYRSDDGKKKQDVLNSEAIERVLRSKGFEEWTRELSKPAPTTSNPTRTVLEKHLTQFTARNTFDYFIHKDLGGFLRRELDFYIKNEVMHLDDIESDTAPRVEQFLCKIKVIRKIAHKIIQFLEQLENFQKKLWVKKKFVVETNYCVTLDRVPDELHEHIVANVKQREEWVRLFAIDKILSSPDGRPGYSEPLTIGFLRANPGLLLDTACFPDDFKSALLANIENLDETVTGLLIHSDSFHALSLAQPKYRNSVECVYIDPPYNTGGDSFVYKDSYQHSSWLTMIRDRTVLARSLMAESSLFSATIDDHEQDRLVQLLRDAFGSSAFLGTVVWQKKYAPANDAVNLSGTHDFVLLFSPGLADPDSGRKDVLTRLPRTDENDAYKNPDDDSRGPWKAGDYTSNKSAAERPNLFYAITNPKTGQDVWPKQDRVWAYTRERHEQNERDRRVWWGKDGTATVPAYKRFLSEVSEQAIKSIWEWEECGHNDQAKKELKHLFAEGRRFETPKPVKLMRRIQQISPTSSKKGIVLDFFAGSGTTGHAAISLSREGVVQRQYVLVEVGDYFNSLLKPRIEKAAYSVEWKHGTPIDRNGGSHLIKYIRLESYEDALNNLELKRSDQQGRLLDADTEMREQYILSYMLDVESRGSQSLLNIEAFRNPDEYKLRVERNGQTQLVNVDLVESFNWLLGLNVKRIDVIRGVRVVEGTAPNDDRVVVVWRNVDQMDNEALDKWFEKQVYNTREALYDVFYVNGDNNLENLRRPDQTWKVRLIEEEFKRLMFSIEDA